MTSKLTASSKTWIFRLLATPTLFLLLQSSAFGQLQTPNVQASDPVDAVAITVTPFGPYPTSVEHSSSPFVLFIVNRSGVLDETFSLVVKPPTSPAAAASTSTASLSPTGTGPSSSSAVPSLLDLHSSQTMQRDHQLICPLPGNYELHFQSHPDWVVDIVITQ